MRETSSHRPRFTTFARLLTLIVALLAAAAGLAPAGAAASARPARFLVGFAKEDITPAVPFTYLGGDGFHRLGTSVLDPIYVRTLAIASADRHGRRLGDPVVISSIDAQGLFSGYQALGSGPASGAGIGNTANTGLADYGLDQIRAAAAQAAGIPAADISFASTHGHNVPDGMGIWGGSPPAYMESLRAAAIRSVVAAVGHMSPAWLRHGQASGDAYVYNPIPTVTGPNVSDRTTWPQASELGVLQALAWGTDRPLVTLFDFGVHPDLLEGREVISPDWPAQTISQVTARYGGEAMFLPGVMGSEPVFPDVSQDPPPGVDKTTYLEMETARYGTEMTGVVDAALAAARPLTRGGVGAAVVRAQVPGTNPLLIAANMVDAPADVQGQIGVGHVERAIVPPYLTGDVLGIPVGAVRIGDGILLNTPGEVYSDVFFSARDQIGAGWYMLGSLTDDQVGYAVMPAEWPVTEAYGVQGPAAAYAIGPSVGAQIVRGLQRTAHALGFPVHVRPKLLVADRDPVAKQLEFCVTSGQCVAALP